MKNTTPRPIEPVHRSASSADTTPGGLAWAAAEAIRALNHLTLTVTAPGAGYTDPSDVDDVIGALLTLTHRLPQALRQASAWLQARHQIGRIGHDQARDPGHGQDLAAVAVPALRTGLDDAASVATVLAGTLQQARDLSCHLTGSH